MAEFSEGTIGEDGKLSIKHVRTLDQSRIRKCPHFMFAPEHYREDETCRCNDPEHTEMADWGYTWDGNLWR